MLNISKKTDIVIPFSKIGEMDWKEKTTPIIKSFLCNWDEEIDYNKFQFEPKSDKEIGELENKIGTSLPEGLKLFYQTFGISDIGEQLQDFDSIGRISDIWDINEDPYYGPDFSEDDLKSHSHLITFSDYLGNGDMFCFHDQTKEIYHFCHDSQPYLIKIFDSIDDYIKGCLIHCQVDLFDVEIGQDRVEEWVNEIMINTFGKDIIHRWFY